ncbi:MAG: hypothetical protein L3J69_16245 [Desulfobacula sp.]|nr:hypothetical protein [Desulfobacula sp.]
MVQVIAHRGARSLAPENSLSAAQLAFDIGSDLWETDVRITRDGHLILFHDELLSRCTDVASLFPSRALDPVNTFSLTEIQSLDAGSYFEKTDPFGQIVRGNISKKLLESYRKERISTLEQGLIFIQKNNWKVNLELKAVLGQDKDMALPEKTLETIRSIGLNKAQVVISSFCHPWLDWITKKYPGIEVQALMGENDYDPLDFADFRFPVYNVNAQVITKAQVIDLKARGKKVNVFTINDNEEFETFVKMGVDGIFTDFSQRFVISKIIS